MAKILDPTQADTQEEEEGAASLGSDMLNSQRVKDTPEIARLRSFLKTHPQIFVPGSELPPEYAELLQAALKEDFVATNRILLDCRAPAARPRGKRTRHKTDLELQTHPELDDDEPAKSDAMDTGEEEEKEEEKETATQKPKT